MAGGGGNVFPTEGADERIKQAIAANPTVMRLIGGADPIPEGSAYVTPADRILR